MKLRIQILVYMLSVDDGKKIQLYCYPTRARREGAYMKRVLREQREDISDEAFASLSVLSRHTKDRKFFDEELIRCGLETKCFYGFDDAAMGVPFELCTAQKAPQPDPADRRAKDDDDNE